MTKKGEHLSTGEDGHRRYKDITGQRFGRLTVIERVGRDSTGRARWKCQCDCGNITNVSSRGLTGGTKSCGCLQREIVGNMQRKDKGVASLNYLFDSYQRGAKRRGLLFNLSKDEFAKLTKQDCHYCGKEPSQIYGFEKSNGYYIYNGIDRLNPQEGYTKENCVPACGDCNFAKQGLTASEFIGLVKRIYIHQKNNGGQDES